MAKDGVKLDGLKELDKALAKLPGKIAKRIANKALRAPARKIKKLAQEKTPELTGAAKQSIIVKTAKPKSKTFNAVHVVADSKKAGKDVFYFKWIEYGKEGVPAVAPLRRATDEVGSSTFKADVAKVLKKDIEKEYAKLVKK